MRKYYIFFLLPMFFIGCISKTSKTSYELNIEETKVNNVNHYIINNEPLAPTIKAKMGDLLTVKVTNNTSKELLLHWHGLLVPNNQDGVPGITSPSIKPKESFTYEFPVKQTGTYWYHAHGLEEAQGIYGGMILSPPGEDLSNDPLFIFSGELGENPEDVLARLVKNTQAMAGITNPTEVMENSMTGMDHSKMVMKPSSKKMDYSKMSMPSHFSDVNYKEHLINGKPEFPTIKPQGEKAIKLRLINAYVDGFLNLVYSGGDIVVIGSDGLDVKPWKTKNLRIAMGETYDILINPVAGKQTELVSFFLGTPNAFSKILIGDGNVEKLASYNYNDFPMDQPYAFLETFKPDFIKIDDTKKPQVTKSLTLEGNHEQYNWSINEQNKIFTDLKLKVGDKVMMTIFNNTDMPHPMHLHGHFFKVILGDNLLLKHTFNIDPKQSLKMEFQVDEEGKWLFHCHNLFHMASGMMVIFEVKK